jgi:hypothetical protein
MKIGRNINMSIDKSKWPANPRIFQINTWPWLCMGAEPSRERNSNSASGFARRISKSFKIF